MNNKEHTLFRKREEPIVKRSSTGGDDRCRFVSWSSLFVCLCSGESYDDLPSSIKLDTPEPLSFWKLPSF